MRNEAELALDVVVVGRSCTCASLTHLLISLMRPTPHARRKRAEIYSTEPRRDIDMRRYFEEGVKMVLDGVVNTSEMVTHVYPLERVDEAFELRNNKSSTCDAIHVLIDCDKNAAQEVVRH